MVSDEAASLRQLIYKDQIVDLVHEYSYCVDHRLYDEVAELFTEDCVVDYGPGIAPVRSRSRLRAMFDHPGAGFAATSHHNANVLVTFDDADRASVRASVYAWHQRSDGSTPQLWGYYHDVVVRLPEGWRIAYRQLRVLGVEDWQMEMHPALDPDGEAMSSGPASRLTGMETERVTVSTTIEAAPEAVFAVLADPSAHAAIDGTGWVRESLDGDRIAAAGQVFRIAMYHEQHPDKDYKTANRVEVFDAPRAIAWQPGSESPETGELSFGGWIWRYDLEAIGPSRTAVKLTYDWSAVGPEVREHLQFPPFPLDHLENSLQHLSDLVARNAAP